MMDYTGDVSVYESAMSFDGSDTQRDGLRSLVTEQESLHGLN